MKLRHVVFTTALACLAGSAFAAPPATAPAAPVKTMATKAKPGKCLERSKLGKCLKREAATAVKK